ncbi:MAG: GxxExxY protein [Candidatus Brocadiaceae bacterium]|nr:GxxExxY protein [Candidatus Brocadiaceae bacterium]
MEEEDKSIHDAQLLTYLKLADLKLGILINFNVPILKEGFKRIVNNPCPTVSRRV